MEQQLWSRVPNRGHAMFHRNLSIIIINPGLDSRARTGCVPRFVEKERRHPLRHQGIRSGGNLRVFENLAQTLVAVDAP